MREETGRVRRLLFVCTGNTCRSPMAEAIARAEARRRGWEEIECRSAGTFGWQGGPASELAVEVARDHGVDLSDHRSTPLIPDLVGWADLVLGMGFAHVEIARELAPGAEVELLTRYLPPDHPHHRRPVSDPVGGSREGYETAFRVLRDSVEALFDHLASQGGGAGPR